MLTIFILCLVMVFILFFIAKGIVKIEPTDKGIFAFMGKRTGKILDEGYHFIIPIINNVITVSCKRTTEEINIGDVFTPDDQAEIIVNVEVTTQPNDLKLYYEVKDPMEQLIGMISETIRWFAADPYSTPNNWKEAVGMSEKFSRMVVAKLLGFSIPRYEKGRNKGKHKKEKDMKPEEIAKKEETITMANNLKTGNGELEIPGIGIIIRRFNITSVEPSAELAKSLEQISKEQQQQVAESVEAQTMAKLIKKFLIELGYTEEEISEPKKIIEILAQMKFDTNSLLRRFSIERGKTKEQVNQILIDGIPDSMIEAIASMAGGEK